MPLRNPLYLDAETLAALADYNCLEDEPIGDVVEVHRTTKEAGLSAGAKGFSAHGKGTQDVERQRSYRIAPKQKAEVSKTIDRLIGAEAVLEIGEDRPPEKDDLVQVEGNLAMTPTSLAGKMLYLLYQFLGEDKDAFKGAMQGRGFSDERLTDLVQGAYFSKDLPPIPLLMEVQNPGYDVRVFVNLDHSGFVDLAQASHVEGKRRVLGQVDEIVDSGPDGYLSAEKWLLPGWDTLLRRLAMTKMTGTVANLVNSLDIDLPVDDVHEYIKGPAIILNAVAVY